MAFGLASAPWVFTILLKPIVALLQAQGIKVVVYLDDFFILRRQSLKHIEIAKSMLETLEFAINLKKSVLTPTGYRILRPKLTRSILRSPSQWRNHPRSKSLWNRPFKRTSVCPWFGLHLGPPFMGFVSGRLYPVPLSASAAATRGSWWGKVICGWNWFCPRNLKRIYHGGFAVWLIWVANPCWNNRRRWSFALTPLFRAGGGLWRSHCGWTMDGKGC